MLRISKQPDTSYVPNLSPGEIEAPSREIYERMGRDNIYRMLEAFYIELGASRIRDMFPEDLVESSRKSAAFFVQLLGGPPEFNERYGSPRMRARHMRFRITTEARAEWLACFERVLSRSVDEFAFPAEHLDGFKRFLDRFSLWMVNTANA